jgi:hypothetical protein
MSQHNHNNQKHEKNLHKCPECGLHYEDKRQVEKCEEWCREHKSCNLEIISQAIENKKI